MLSDLERSVLKELLRDAKISDRSLARKLNASQPTITRIRNKLERDGYIRGYTILPDFRKLGFEIIAFSFVRMNPKIYSKIEDIKKYGEKWTNTVFVSRGEGMGMTSVMISFHKNYADYFQRLTIFRRDWGEYIEDLQTFVTVVGQGTMKEFSLEYLAEHI